MKKNYVSLLSAAALIGSSVIPSFAVAAEKKEPVRQQKGIAQKWLWNGAKVVGAVALVGLAVYTFFQIPPVVAPNMSNIKLLPNAIPPTADNSNVTLLSVMEAPKQLLPLTKEEYEKYKNASNAYGKATVFFSIAALINPIFVPYAVATYLGSLYYGVKTLDLKPVDWRNFPIPTQEMPY